MLTEYPYPQRVLPFILEDKANRLADAPLLLGDQTMTYAEVCTGAASFGAGLRQLGVRPGDRVLAMLPNVAEAVVTFLGIAWIGAIGVPINSGYRGDLLRYVIADADADVLVIHTDFLATFLAISADVPRVRMLVVCGDASPRSDIGDRRAQAWDELVQTPPCERAELKPSDLQAIMYTSGTTGPSKGVMVPFHHAYQYANPVANHFQDEGDVIYVTLPLFHIGGQWQGIYAALLCEGKAVLKKKFSVGSFWADVDRYGVTQTTLLGVMAEFLWKQESRPDDAEHPLVRATMAPALANAPEFAKRFGVRLAQGWGLTETGAVTVPPPLDEPEQDPMRCGRVRSDMFELILVDDDDQRVPVGTAGQALVRPKEPFAVMSGYWRKPEATVACWKNLWLHTGDALVEHPDGTYSFVDRQKDCIRRRGENISSLEVEQSVLTHPDVQECAAVPVRSEHIEDEVMIVISLREGARLEPKVLHAYLTTRMADFMVPRYIRIADVLPKTLTSKIKKDEIRAAGVVEGTWDRASAGTRAP
jgi:carnitine-CoA ligase